MISILIPSRNERFLTPTIKDLLAKATGEIEIIVNVDENWPEEIVQDARVTYIHPGRPKGMRWGINAAAAIARGQYLLKTDGHCLFAPGFDQALAADCDDNWVVIPRRKRLDAEKWQVTEENKPDIDYHYLSCPMTNPDGYSMHGYPWPQRSQQRSDPQYDIDDTMSFQGSCWFMSTRHFHQFLQGLNEQGYGSFCQEPQEVGNKTWLGGGRVVVNKKTWYAHLHKGKQYGRGYFQNKREIVRGVNWAGHYWLENQWPQRIHDFDWLIDKFWPVPSWPQDWKTQVGAAS